jgi:fibrillarin-like rRNA methylase
MYKIVLLVVLVIFTTSCSLGKPNVYNPNAKAFAEEDAYILFALRAEQIRNYAAASALFEQLYIKSKKKSTCIVL